MSIGTSDGEHFDSEWEHALSKHEASQNLSQQVAGDVLPMQPSEQYLNTAGPTPLSAPYAYGLKKDPSIAPLPIDTLNAWQERMTKKRSDSGEFQVAMEDPRKMQQIPTETGQPGGGYSGSGTKVVAPDYAPERISEAAIKHADGITTGLNHGDAYMNAAETAWKSGKSLDDKNIEAGFMTSTGRFVGRQEALDIAEKNSQLRDNIRPRESKDTLHYRYSKDPGGLANEDLIGRLLPYRSE